MKWMRESINHVLFDCTFARHIWAQSNFPFPKDGFNGKSIHVNIFYLLRCLKNVLIPIEIRRFPWILWIIWKHQNMMIFEGNVFSAPETAANIWEDSNQ